MGKGANVNELSPELLAQIYAQESNDPYLTLITLSHSSFPAPLLFVNNSVSIVSRGETYLPFPVTLVLPVDDGETNRQVTMNFDNVSLELVNEIRSVTGNENIQVNLEMILASIPDQVQVSVGELKILGATYNLKTMSLTLGLDDFMNTELSSERYTPKVFRGLF